MKKHLKTATRANYSLGDLILAVSTFSKNNRETVAAVATFAADHDDPTRARRTLRGREPGEHGLGGAASGILHQGRARDPQVADRALVDPAHLFASDDRQNGSASYRQRGGLGQEVGEDREVWLARIDAREPRQLEVERARGKSQDSVALRARSAPSASGGTARTA